MKIGKVEAKVSMDEAGKDQSLGGFVFRVRIMNVTLTAIDFNLINYKLHIYDLISLTTVGLR